MKEDNPSPAFAGAPFAGGSLWSVVCRLLLLGEAYNTIPLLLEKLI